MDTSELLEKLKNVLQKEKGVKFAYLFGSRSQGAAGPLSDYDVAVYLEEKDRLKRSYKRLNLIGKVARALGDDRVDLLVLNDIDAPLLLYNIISGELVFSRDESERIEFETRATSLYFDFVYLLDSNQRVS